MDVCMRPGCSNEIPPSKGYRPRKYCGDKRCTALRFVTYAHNYRVRKGEIEAKIRPFSCEDCGALVQPKNRHVRKHKCDECKRKEANRIQRERYAAMVAAKAQERPPEVVLPPPPPPPEPEPIEEIEPADDQSPMEGIDRGTRYGFVKYMKANPYYFDYVFPGMTIRAAWRQVKSWAGAGMLHPLQ